MNIVFLGDSLIEYFDWQKKFSRHRVANLGVAGESVEGLLARVLKMKEFFPGAEMIFIMSGINNVAMGDLEFIDIYRIILERLSSAYTGARIFVTSLLPTMVDFIEHESIKRVNSSLKEAAKDSGVEYLDIYGKFVDTKGNPIKEYLLDDGVHLSSEGYAVWAKALMEILD